MKRKEAIERIKTEKALICGGCTHPQAIGYCENTCKLPEALDMAIDALQVEPTYRRLIDANALMEYCSNQKTKTISNNDIARFPTAQIDRPYGEWICKGDYAICSKCGGSSGTQFDGVEPIPRITTFCPHCGSRMTKGGDIE